MDKYQQALVRDDLESLASYPILNGEGDLLGILNLDSPARGMLVHFGDPRAHRVLEAAVQGLSGLLQPVQ